MVISKRMLWIVLPVLAVVALGFSSCEQNHYYTGPDYLYYEILIQNRTPWDIYIYLDGGYLCFLAPYSHYRAYPIIEGDHLLEALDRDNYVLASRSFYLHDNFVWVLE